MEFSKSTAQLQGNFDGRNDLVVTVQNETRYELTIYTHTEHGKLKKYPTDNRVAVNGQWEGGVEAQGAGSNLTLGINVQGNQPHCFGWAVMSATPPNKTNYVKVAYNDSGFSSGSEAYKSADSQSKHYANDGYYTNVRHDVEIIVSISQDSGASSTIIVRETASRGE
ncbi:hypothetical protein [Pseudoalteromonas sp. R3]|uniref:hypothetical protein n=1 Tax=Pseudoalteromonas sp. R3 TaxID=1709477 RepID=UPI000A969855|nr:hypothetical protein [Pseudoalteromonas sp. R3]AZZ96132.1 hypothetical protein ELR70_02710 [Pseudoalteromonas sp. R3]